MIESFTEIKPIALNESNTKIHFTNHGRILCHLTNGGLVFTMPHVDVEGTQEHLFCPDCLRRWKNEQKGKIIQKFKTNNYELQLY